MYEPVCDMLEFAKSMIKDCKKVSTKTYLGWLASFINTDEYKNPINKFIALNKLLKDENNQEARTELIDHISNLENTNKNKKE